MSLLPVILSVVLVFDIGLLFLLWRVAKVSDGLGWATWYSRPPLYKERCKACDGCGVQMLDHGKWVILPHHQRGYTKQRKMSMEFRAGTPNVRKCPSCLGQTFRWKRVEPG